MPSEIYMKIDNPDGCLTEEACGKESIGSFFKSDHDEQSLVLSFRHRVSVPTNKLTGQVTGTRKHEFLTITKLVDKSSPLLLNEVVSPSELDVEFEFYRTPDETSGGDQVHYYTIVLERAKIIAIETISPDILDTSFDEYTAYEEVTFTYGKIEVTHELGNTNVVDDWSGEGG